MFGGDESNLDNVLSAGPADKAKAPKRGKLGFSGGDSGTDEEDDLFKEIDIGADEEDNTSSGAASANGDKPKPKPTPSPPPRYAAAAESGQQLQLSPPDALDEPARKAVPETEPQVPETEPQDEGEEVVDAEPVPLPQGPQVVPETEPADEVMACEGGESEEEGGLAAPKAAAALQAAAGQRAPAKPQQSVPATVLEAAEEAAAEKAGSAGHTKPAGGLAQAGSAAPKPPTTAPVAAKAPSAVPPAPEPAPTLAAPKPAAQTKLSLLSGGQSSLRSARPLTSAGGAKAGAFAPVLGAGQGSKTLLLPKPALGAGAKPLSRLAPNGSGGGGLAAAAPKGSTPLVGSSLGPSAAKSSTPGLFNKTALQRPAAQAAKKPSSLHNSLLSRARNTPLPGTPGAETPTLTASAAAPRKLFSSFRAGAPLQASLQAQAPAPSPASVLPAEPTEAEAREARLLALDWSTAGAAAQEGREEHLRACQAACNGSVAGAVLGNMFRLQQSQAELEGAERVLSAASLGVATLSMRVDFLDDPLKKAALDSLTSHLADYLALLGGCAGVSAAAAAAVKRSAPFAAEEGEEPAVDPTPDNATPADAAAEGAVAMEQA